MKILIISPDFPPTLNSCARLMNELTEGMINHGNAVSVVTRTPNHYLKDSNSTTYNQLVSIEELGPNLKLYKVRPLISNRTNIFLRILSELWTSFMFLLVCIFIQKHHAYIVYSPPMFLAVAGTVIKKIKGGHLIINVQDLYPRTAIDLKKVTNTFAIRFAKWLEKSIYKYSDAITVHSKGNKDHVIKQGGNPESTFIVHNWIDLDKYNPDRENLGTWRKEHAIHEPYMITFAGTMGFAQGLEAIIRVAEHFRDSPDIVFILCGSGVSEKPIINMITELNLTNVKIFPHQSEEEYIKLLKDSDICLITLNENLKTSVVPGKLQCCMAVGKPVIGVSNIRSGLKYIIEKSNCGFHVSNTDTESFYQHILKIKEDTELSKILGLNGRTYAEDNFDKHSSIAKYVQIIHKIDKSA